MLPSRTWASSNLAAVFVWREERTISNPPAEAVFPLTELDSMLPMCDHLPHFITGSLSSGQSTSLETTALGLIGPPGYTAFISGL